MSLRYEFVLMFFQGLAVLFIDVKQGKHKDPFQLSDKNVVSLIKNYDDRRKKIVIITLKKIWLGL